MSNKFFSQKELLEKVVSALKNFIDDDGQLLTLTASERSISHKFAEHLQRKFTEWNVDCEYNRKNSQVKTINISCEEIREEIRADDQEAKTVFPDIVVHKRGEAKNLIIIEIKKSSSTRSPCKDIKKLKAFTGPEYEYDAGLFVLFDVKNKKIGCVRWFENGKEIDLDPTIKTNLEALGYEPD